MSEQRQLTTQNSRPFVIFWNAHIKANSLTEAEEDLKQISESIGYEITVYKHEQYPQSDTLFEVAFLCHLDTYEVSTAIASAFQINVQIAERWEVTMPEWLERHRDEWAFLGKAINPKNSSIEMIEFNLRRKPWSFYRIKREHLL